MIYRDRERSVKDRGETSKVRRALARYVYLRSFFLEPEDIKSQNLRSIWHFSEAARLP
jgi:hypothetical protein